MRLRSLSELLSCFLAVFGLGSAGIYSGGNGSADNPYQISSIANWQELMATSSDWDKHFILTADIDMQGVAMTPVGNNSIRFSGIFDGNGKIISNVVINQPSSDYVGLFGYLGSGGQVKNMGMENADITGRYYVGGLIGHNDGAITYSYSTGFVSGDFKVGGLVGDNYYGIITSCYSIVSVSATSSVVGGLVGSNFQNTISHCYSTGSVSGTTYVGGLVGSNYIYGTITVCYFSGSVNGSSYLIGGLVGGNGGIVTFCYSTGLVSGRESTGGLVGGNSGHITSCYSRSSVNGISTYSSAGGLVGDNSRNITSCYSAGLVVGTSNFIGGLAGKNSGIITSCFWDIETSGQTNSPGGTGKTTCEMQTLSTFTEAGWDFYSDGGDMADWMMFQEGDTYPWLSWETLTFLIGNGTETNPYLIQSLADFLVFTNPINAALYWASGKHTKLMCNIDLSGIIYTQAVIAPAIDIGGNLYQTTPFNGSFDGNNHLISDLTINQPTQVWTGLFGRVGNGGHVSNLGLENVYINGWLYVGGLVGQNDGIVTNSYLTGTVNGTFNVGGLVGENEHGTILSCYSIVSVSGTSSIGGLVGQNYSIITSCYANSSALGEDYVGGLVGSNAGIITSCYSSGSVTGRWNVAGLVGDNYEGTITSCYSTDSVVGTRYNIGGLVGSNDSGIITSCYATGMVSGIGSDYNSNLGGLVGANHTGYITISDNYATGIVNCTRESVGELVGYSDTPINLEGNVTINSLYGTYTHRWNNLVLHGTGTINMIPDVALNLSNSTVSCNIAGTGTIQVDLDAETVIEGNAMIDLAHETDSALNGKIQCDGLLRIKDNVQLQNANVTVTRSSFEGDVDIYKSVITAEAGSPYGQFFIEDTVRIEDNHIHADGDRYMDLDPSVFAGLIANNKIYVTITEGIGSSRGGLFELRGDPNLVGTLFPPDEFFCYLENIPEFDTQSWTLERLELVDGAKLNLTNRFDFGNGGHNEVLYVKEVILGENSQLNTAFNRLYYGYLDGDPDCIKNKPLLGFSLNNVACNNDNEFITRIVHNNYIDRNPNPPDYTRIHVARITGDQPDPAGMMRMRNLTDTEPDSSTYNQVINARAKALFAKASEDRILIHFEYLFETDDPSVQLVIYLSDKPEIMDHGDSDFYEHYIEVYRLLPPLSGQPGSEGSGRFGVFNREFSRRDLDFIRGTRIEFELVGPDGASILIDNWDPQVYCSELYCSDIDGGYRDQ